MVMGQCKRPQDSLRSVLWLNVSLRPCLLPPRPSEAIYFETFANTFGHLPRRHVDLSPGALWTNICTLLPVCIM